MTNKVPSPNQNASGLQGKDRKQGALRDVRQGTFDPVGNQIKENTSERTDHQNAQPGADVRGDPVRTQNFNIPEGLKRQPVGPYDKNRGRDNQRPPRKPD